MSLANDAWDCANELTDFAKTEHGRWMGQGSRDQQLKRQIDMMRKAAKLLKDAAMQLNADHGQTLPLPVANALMIEAITAMRNASEGRIGWLPTTKTKRLEAVNAIAGITHNLHPQCPVSVIVTSFKRVKERAPEAIAMLPQLTMWVEQTGRSND